MTMVLSPSTIYNLISQYMILVKFSLTPRHVTGCSTIYIPNVGWFLKFRVTNHQGALPLKLRGELILLRCHCCTTLFLLPMGTLSSIVPHLLNSKEFNFAHVLFLLTSSLLLLGPIFGTLLSLLISLFQKRKIFLIIPTTLLTSRS
jgi:hypothetical protein